MKKKFVLTVIAVLVLAISLTAVLAACGNGDTPSHEQQEQQEQRQQNIFALAAVSAGELIGGDGVAAAALAAGDTNAIAAELDEYMAMLDKIIGGEHPITSTVADNTSEEYSQYKIVQTVTAASPDGSSETYTIYYNEEMQPNYDRDDDDDEPVNPPVIPKDDDNTVYIVAIAAAAVVAVLAAIILMQSRKS